MAKPLRLPGVEEQRALDGLEIHLLLDGEQQERWNQHIIEQHYLHSAKLVGEQLRYALSYRDLEEIMREWGLPVDHTTIFRSRPALCARTGKTLSTASENLQ